VFIPRQLREIWLKGFHVPTVEKLDVCLVVSDASGQQLSYVYFEDELGRRSAAKLLSKDEARRIAANLARYERQARAPE
jgi:hypothetical protein